MGKDILAALNEKYNLGDIEYSLNEKDLLESLEIKNSDINNIPPEVFEIKSLKHLDLSGNKIKKINPKISELKNLEYLNLFGNQISKIPESVFSLPKLTSLHVGQNNIKSINITENKSKLKSLSLNHNPLEKIPLCILKIKSLESLRLPSCMLKTIPKEIRQLKNLRSLNISHNLISELPRELSELSELKRLYLFENPIANVPEIILTKGTQTILSYLENKKINLWSAKMVLVGQGGTGKSCLLDSIKGLEFNPEKDTTHGMVVEELEVQHPKSRKVKMNLRVWDFGGQEIYHATHQFYLTNKALFVLVWSARLGYKAGKIYHWLETIQALAPDSPILIVATHSEPRSADLPKKDILYNYPQVSFFEIDNKTGLGIKELKKAITNAAVKLPNMGIERPVSWIKAAKEINLSEKNYISRKELFDIFFKVGIESEEIENPAGYLHELGDILYYPDESELKDTIIIKPQWVSNHIAKILDDKETDKTAGFLQRKVMNKLWSDLDEDMRDKFILLMEKYDLAYKVDDKETVCLVVEKLKHEEADFIQRWKNFKNKNEITIIYDELSALPAGIPTWFIARTHRFTTFTHWRLGALLKYKKHLSYDKDLKIDDNAQTLALIIAKPESRQILLKVRGANPSYFSAILRDTLEFTLNRFEGLKMNVKIPCPGHNDEKCEHLFKLSNLKKYLDKTPPVYEIECPEAIEKVSIPKMLYGISHVEKNGVVTNDNMIVEMRRLFDKQADLIEDKSNEIVNALRKKFDDMQMFIQLEFLKSYQLQQKIQEITCPNLFTLTSKEDKTFFEKLRFDIYHLQLQLWCQYPGHQHPVGTPYEIKVSKKWLLRIAPYYNRMLKFLQWTMPFVSPALKNIFGNSEIPFENETKLAKNIINSIGEINPEKIGFEHNDNLRYTEEREDLHLISELLNKHDPSKKWGGLIRKVTPEGYIIWICKGHVEKYNIPVKITDKIN